MKISPTQAFAAILMTACSPLPAMAQVLDIDTDTSLTSGAYATINVDPGAAQVPAITVNLSGTARTNDLNVYNTATLNLSANARVLNALTATDSAIVNMSAGARVSSLAANGSSQINATDGTIDINIFLTNNSRITYSATSNGGIFGFDNSQITMTGGSNSLYINNDVVLNIEGGTIANHDARDNSVTNLRGGTFTVNRFLGVFGNSVLNVYGTNLSMSFAGTGSSTNGTYRRFIFSGTLEDGTSLDGVSLYDYDGGREVVDPANPNGVSSPINFNPSVVTVPEPTTLAHLTLGIGAGAYCLAIARRKKNG